MTNHVHQRQNMPYHQLLIGKERVLLWEKVRGIWKNRKPNPIKELDKIRREWERKLPASHSK